MKEYFFRFCKAYKESYMRDGLASIVTFAIGIIATLLLISALCVGLVYISSDHYPECKMHLQDGQICKIQHRTYVKDKCGYMYLDYNKNVNDDFTLRTNCNIGDKK